MTVQSDIYQLDLALLPIAAVVVDADGRVTWFNDEAARLLAVDEHQLRGQPWQSLVTGDEPDDDRCALRSKKSGVLLSARKVQLPHSDEKAWLLSDFVDDPWLDHSLVTLQRLYQRGGMSGGIAHEINNFLAIIQGNVELMPLLMRKGDQEKIEKKLELMKRSCESITKLCDGFMDMCEDQPRMVPCNINHVVEHALQFLTPQNMFDEVEVTTELHDDIPLVVADPGLLQQAVINLLVNAATAVAGLEQRVVRVVTSVESTGDGRTIGIAVEDSGAGIASHLKDGLRRRRVSSAESQLGLGLLVAERIMAAHGGSVQFGASDNGTVVSLHFPARPVEPADNRQ